MKISYLILAHENPNHLKRLINALSCSSCEFFIQIDNKAKLENFALVNGRATRFCEDRVSVYWGEYSTVQAMINLLRQALGASGDSDYFAFLSGSDYPLHGNRYIFDFFEKNRGKEFMNIVEMPDRKKPIRLLNVYVEDSNKPVRKWLKHKLGRMGVKKYVERDYRDYLTLQPYGGSQWWALTREACQYILRFVDDEANKPTLDFYKNTNVPDEMVFHTILGNSPFKAKISRNLHYTDWSGGGYNPAWIGAKHLEHFQANRKLLGTNAYGNGELLFARKFSGASEEIVAKINAMIEEENSALFGS